MTSPFLEQQKQKQQNPDASNAPVTPPGPYAWWIKHWWKFLLIPLVFQLLAWIWAVLFSAWILHQIPQIPLSQ